MGKVLVLHGADDPLAPDAEVLTFEKEMRDANVDWQLISYGGTSTRSFKASCLQCEVRRTILGRNAHVVL
jgi:hypothetical protein